jgi:hypothetical protein
LSRHASTTADLYLGRNPGVFCGNVIQARTPALSLEGSMASLVNRLSHVWALLFVAMSAVTSVAHAEDFRIETKIFVGDSKEPVSETTTLFVGRVVYDFIAEPPQTAVFSKPHGDKPGRFILLDPQHKYKTELSTDQLSGAMNKLRTWAGRQSDPFLQFAADPQFKESFESGSGKLVLANYLESYTVSTRKAEHPQAAAEYREFLDWYTRLNTLISAGPPPEPRLRLNEALARHEVIPLKVELTRSGEGDPIRAEHQFIWRLSNDDRSRINDVATSLSKFRSVSNEEFLRVTRSDASED